MIVNSKALITAGTTAFFITTLSNISNASEFGCKVLLCLSDPRGATTESECRPPIKKLLKRLAKGKSFPSCSEAEKSGSYVKNRGVMPYEKCPDGMRHAPMETRIKTPRDNGTYPSFKKIGGSRWPIRACVGKPLGDYQREGDYGVIYPKIIWNRPHPKPRVFDIYIDNKFYKRIRTKFY